MSSESDGDGRRRRFFNAEVLREHFEKSRVVTRDGWRALRAVRQTLDSFSGLMFAFVGYPIFIGLPILFLLGLMYGPWVFLVGTGLIVALTGYWVDRKVGRVLRFDSYNFPIRLAAIAVAFLFAIGLIYLIVYLPRPH